MTSFPQSGQPGDFRPPQEPVSPHREAGRLDRHGDTGSTGGMHGAEPAGSQFGRGETGLPDAPSAGQTPQIERSPLHARLATELGRGHDVDAALPGAINQIVGESLGEHATPELIETITELFRDDPLLRDLFADLARHVQDEKQAGSPQ